MKTIYDEYFEYAGSGKKGYDAFQKDPSIPVSKKVLFGLLTDILEESKLAEAIRIMDDEHREEFLLDCLDTISRKIKPPAS